MGDSTTQVERILKVKNDYYQVLQIKRSASATEIKSSYKKISLQVHPDRNSHPKASEAFNVIVEAKDCLTNENSRRIYDATGSNPSLKRPIRNQDQSPFQPFPFATRGAGFQHVFREGTFKVGPDGSFYFIPNNHPRAARGFHSHQNFNRHAEEKKDGSATLLLQVLMVFVFVFVAFFFGTGGTSKDFSFVETQVFNIRRQTSTGITFFTPKNVNFDDKAIAKLEPIVIQSWLSEMKYKCEYEIREQKKLFNAAERSFGSRRQDILDSANNFNFVHCTQLNNYLKVKT